MGQTAGRPSGPPIAGSDPPGFGTRPDTQDGSDSAPSPWLVQGAHRSREHGDVLLWECHGPMQVPDLRCLFERRAAVQARHGRAFLLVDARRIDGVPPETRRYAIQQRPSLPIEGLAVVLGAGLASRTLISLTLRAARLLGRSEKETSRLVFADSEAEAMALIDAERRALHSASKPRV